MYTTLQIVFWVLYLLTLTGAVDPVGLLEVELLNNTKFQHSMALPNKVLTRISPSSVLVCVKSCLLNSQCLSINFNRIFLVCELNAGAGDTATLVTTPGVMYSMRSSWNANASAFGECATINCSNGTKCLTISGIVKCIGKVPYCGEPVRIENSTVNSPYSGELGAVRSYKCIDRTISESPITSTCLSDGTWSIPVVTCRYVESCMDVKKCSSSYSRDGEYWMYPSAVENKPVKIYCHGMSTTTPKEFLTLVYENKAFYAFKEQKNGVSRCSRVLTKTWPASGTTTYQKVRINTANMEVIGNDFTFSSTTNVNNKIVKYGHAQSCSLYHSCVPLGTMKLDITNTGLIFNNETTWETYGWAGKIGHVTFKSNTLIDGRCDGYAGGCRPTTPLNFKIDQSYNHRESVASCLGLQRKTLIGVFG